MSESSSLAIVRLTKGQEEKSVEIRTCPICGNKFKPKRSDQKNCSMECNKKSHLKTIRCAGCGHIFGKTERSLRLRGFCSDECWQMYLENLKNAK